MFDNIEFNEDEIIESLRNVGIVAEAGEPGTSVEEVFATGRMPMFADSPIFEPSDPCTLEVSGCNKIILKNKTLDFVFEIEQPQIEEFEKIIINGITFVKEEK